MNQKEEKLESRYGIMELEENHKPNRRASHEYDSTRSKETSSGSKVSEQER